MGNLALEKETLMMQRTERRTVSSESMRRQEDIIGHMHTWRLGPLGSRNGPSITMGGNGVDGLRYSWVNVVEMELALFSFSQ